jgi:hypothetical protein
MKTPSTLLLALGAAFAAVASQASAPAGNPGLGELGGSSIEALPNGDVAAEPAGLQTFPDPQRPRSFLFNPKQNVVMMSDFASGKNSDWISLTKTDDPVVQAFIALRSAQPKALTAKGLSAMSLTDVGAQPNLTAAGLLLPPGMTVGANPTGGLSGGGMPLSSRTPGSTGTLAPRTSLLGGPNSETVTSAPSSVTSGAVPDPSKIGFWTGALMADLSGGGRGGRVGAAWNASGGGKPAATADPILTNGNNVDAQDLGSLQDRRVQAAYVKMQTVEGGAPALVLPNAKGPGDVGAPLGTRSTTNGD